ncbi:MAG TPA: hypothetical protein DIC42_04530 [Holosporales bacterium]|nr:hypothetical protein [Holosporales bacterium]
MFLILILFSCVYLYGVDGEQGQKTPTPRIPKLNLPRFGQVESPEFDASRTTSLAGVSSDTDSSEDSDEEEDVRAVSLSDFQFDDVTLTTPRIRWVVPFYVGKINLLTAQKKTIPLPNIGTPEEIEDRKRIHREAIAELVTRIKERSIEILTLKLTEPIKPK